MDLVTLDTIVYRVLQIPDSFRAQPAAMAPGEWRMNTAGVSVSLDTTAQRPRRHRMSLSVAMRIPTAQLVAAHPLPFKVGTTRVDKTPLFALGKMFASYIIITLRNPAVTLASSGVLQPLSIEYFCSPYHIIHLSAVFFPLPHLQLILAFII